MSSREPNEQLRGVITTAGLTYDATARLVRLIAAECGETLRTNKSAVAHWVGGTPPSPATTRYLATALERRLGRPVTPADLGLADRQEDETGIDLSNEGDPIDSLLPLWRSEVDLNRRRFLTSSAYSVAAAALPLTAGQEAAGRVHAVRTSGAVVGMAEVNAVRDMIQMMTEIDERHGGQHGRTALAQYLHDDVAPLCRARCRTEEVQREMLSAASRGVHLLGWKAYDSGQQGLAQAYYLQSYRLAAEAGIPGQDGFVMRTMAMQGLKIHRPEHCLSLAEEGLRRARGRVDAATEAMFLVVHAHALAKAGQGRAALAGTERAARLLEGAPGDPVQFWGLTWGPPAASVHSRTAKVHETLGDHQAAALHYARAAAARPEPHARIVALDLVAGGEMQLRQGGIEQACESWGRALDHLDGIRSTRAVKALHSIRRDLRRFRARGVRCAVELDERTAELLTTVT